MATYAHVRDRATIVRDEAGDAVRMVGSLVDTTERTRADLLAQGQSRLLEQIAAGLDLGAVLDRVVRFTETHGSDLARGDHPARSPSPASSGWPPRRAFPPRCGRRSPLSRVEAGAGVSAIAALRRDRVVFPDLAGDPAAEAGGRSCSSRAFAPPGPRPLFATGRRLLGTLDVHYREPHAPGPDDLSLVEAAGHLAEIAIERGRSQDTLARGMRLLEQVLDNLAGRRLGSRPGRPRHVRQPRRPGHLGRRALCRPRGVRGVPRLAGGLRRADRRRRMGGRARHSQGRDGR